MDIQLISPTPDDAAFWLKVRLQKSTQDHNPMGLMTEDKLRQQISKSNFEFEHKKSVHRFYMQLKNSEFVGVISIKDINWASGCAELGYLVAEEFHGKGYATHAVQLLLKKAFAAGLKKVKATTITENIASFRVLEKCGFQLEGFLKKEFLVRERLRDVYLWACTPETFQASRQLHNESIRSMLISDLEVVQRLCFELDYSPEKEVVANSIATCLYNPDYEPVVIFNKEKIVGWMNLQKRFRIEDVSFLQIAAIVTDQNYRSQGYGKKLLDYAESRARQLGYSFVGLHSGKRRTRAHQFYERNGYQILKDSYFLKKSL